jgi:Cys-rich protein (TIGR01571 family)
MRAERPSSRGSVTIDDRPNSRGDVVGGSGLGDTSMWPPAPQTMDDGGDASMAFPERPLSGMSGVSTGGSSEFSVGSDGPNLPPRLRDDSDEDVGGDPRLTLFVPSHEPLSPIAPTPTTLEPEQPQRLVPEPEPEPQPKASAQPAIASTAGELTDLRKVIADAQAATGKGRQPKEVAIPSPGMPGSIGTLGSGGASGKSSGRSSTSSRPRIATKNWAVHGGATTQEMAGALQDARRKLLAEKMLSEQAAVRWKPDLKNLKSEYEIARQEAVRLFKAIDADGNGFVTKKEMKAAMIDRGAEIDDSEIAEMLNAGEVDGDGVINCDEYVTMVLQAKKQQEEEEEARRLADEKDGTKKRRAKRLNDKEKRLANHWDMLGTDVKTYDDANDEYGDDENTVFGDGLDGNGGFLGSLSPGKKGKGKVDQQKATWQNSLGDFVAFPLVFLKSCCCPCVQFGLNSAEVLEPECAACHADGNCCATYIVPPHRHAELCVPLALGWLMLCPLVATIGGGCARYRLRRQLGIGGSAWNDCAVHLCCSCCAIIQEGAELGHDRVRRQAEAQALAREQRRAMRGAQPVDNSMGG